MFGIKIVFRPASTIQDRYHSIQHSWQLLISDLY
jgi:hypothetical protein